MNSIIFRSARLFDVEEIRFILIHGFIGFSRSFKPSALNINQSHIVKSISDWRVVSLNDTIVGCVKAYIDDDYFTFCYLTIREDFQKKGLGEKFVKFIILEAKKKNINVIKIVLRESLTSNVRFFSKLGFLKTTPFKSKSHYIYELRIQS